MVWRKDDPEGDETGKIRWELPRYTRGLGLDIGCGRAKGYPHFIGVDRDGAHLKHKTNLDADVVVEDAARLPMFSSGSMDFVFSSHLLEHLADTKVALAEWWRVLKPGGHLCLYLPHKDFYPNVGKPGANPDHKHDLLPADIEAIMSKIGSWDLLRNDERNDENEYSFFQVYKKLASGQCHRHTHKKPRPAKTAAIVRYGGWGDALQMSSILPGLKAQGYHVTLYATERAWEVVREDPNIDEVYLQDTDQVPNSHLGTFWENEQKKYDKWINLSESVEATWLSISDKGMWHKWPQSVRQKYLSRTNYVEFQHDVAEVPYTKPLQHFYQSPEEKKWAIEQKKKFGGDPTIMWVTNGTSAHKLWPHVDQIFARVLLTWPDVRIVVCGDAKGLTVLDPWKKEKRVIWAGAGVFSIRQSLAFAEVCDLVVGPETGVMSSVAMSEVPKIVFLSHSSHENLTRDWMNTYALFSTKTKCYPCNMLHYDWTHCWRNEDKGDEAYWSGTAQCQVDIPPEACWMALCRALGAEIESTEPQPELETAVIEEVENQECIDCKRSLPLSEFKVFSGWRGQPLYAVSCNECSETKEKVSGR